MMQITTRAAWKKFSLLLLIPLLAATTLILAECKPVAGNEETPSPQVTEAAPEEFDESAATEADAEEETVAFTLVQVKPQFDGGDANQFSHWVNQNLKYPQEARGKGLQGRVTLQFTVEKDGSVTGVKVLRGVDPLLDNEAVRVISQSPNWTPGFIDGNPVRVTYNFPVVFQLK